MSEITDQQHIDFVNSVARTHELTNEVIGHLNGSLNDLVRLVAENSTQIGTLAEVLKGLQERVEALEAKR